MAVQAMIQGRSTSAHRDALYMLFIVPNLRIYTQPKQRLQSAEIRDRTAEVRVTGSEFALGIWRSVIMALIKIHYDH